MHSFQNFIVKLIPNHPPPLETRKWKLVVRALQRSQNLSFYKTFRVGSFAVRIFLPFFCALHFNTHV